METKKEIPITLPVIPPSDAQHLRVTLVRTAWNDSLVTSLVNQTKKELIDRGILAQNIREALVPGSFELPWACQKLAEKRDCDVIIAFGVLIKGETYHFEYISESVAHGLMEVQLKTGIPILNGVLNCGTIAHAEARCGTGSQLPQSLAVSAIHMAAMYNGRLTY